jgi:WD40 repeat protein
VLVNVRVWWKAKGEYEEAEQKVWRPSRRAVLANLAGIVSSGGAIATYLATLSETTARSFATRLTHQGSSLINFATDHNYAIEFQTLSWSSNGKLIAQGENNQLSIWNSETGSLVRTFAWSQNFPDLQLASVGWSPDSRWLVVAGTSLTTNDISTKATAAEVANIAAQVVETLFVE